MSNHREVARGLLSCKDMYSKGLVGLGLTSSKAAFSSPALPTIAQLSPGRIVQSRWNAGLLGFLALKGYTDDEGMSRMKVELHRYFTLLVCLRKVYPMGIRRTCNDIERPWLRSSPGVEFLRIKLP